MLFDDDDTCRVQNVLYVFYIIFDALYRCVLPCHIYIHRRPGVCAVMLRHRQQQYCYNVTTKDIVHIYIKNTKLSLQLHICALIILYVQFGGWMSLSAQ